MRTAVQGLAALTVLMLPGAARAQTIETAPFISAPIASMDFETLSQPTFNLNTVYMEGGIAISYVWTNPYLFAQMYSEGFDLGGGTHGWLAADYEGYTSITLASGTAFNQIQFGAATGYPHIFNPLQYELRYHGSVVGTGQAGSLAALGSGVSTFGFSGTWFDEIRLRNDPDIAEYRNISSSDALALDHILIGISATAVPEPSTWALMLAAFGVLGSFLRLGSRRQGTLQALSTRS
jgi:hypothetical protein